VTPPRHPADDELRAFIDSTPPPAPELAAVASRLTTDTGLHDLHKLQEYVRAEAVRSMRERAERAEWWIRWLLGIVAGVLILVVAAILLGKGHVP
jgi:hypothetical protein